jgi:hypothetical protein
MHSAGTAVPLIVFAMMAPALSGCGSPKHALIAISVNPTAASATHGSPDDTVTFTATGNFGTYDIGWSNQARATCVLRAADTTQPVTALTWSTSDPSNTRIDAHGMATCVGPTPSPVTIRGLATGICGGVASTASLTCN